MTGVQSVLFRSPDDYQTALDVLSEAAVYWKAKGTPFVVFVDGATDLPAL